MAVTHSCTNSRPCFIRFGHLGECRQLHALAPDAARFQGCVTSGSFNIMTVAHVVRFRNRRAMDLDSVC
eukprot:11164712-Lingulodinium_polyedra.AAC.1